jgi:thiol-disulfide isomerase/thioredoxin
MGTTEEKEKTAMSQMESQGVESGGRLAVSGSDRSPGNRPGAWQRVVVVSIVLAAIVVTIVLKSSTNRQAGQSAGRKERTTFVKTEILATVNGEPIALADLDAELEGMAEEFHSIYKNAKHELLEDMITRKLLLREAKRIEVAESPAYKEALSQRGDGAGHEDESLLSALLKTQVFDQIQVGEEELHNFYERTGAATGQDFNAVRESLRVFLLQQKQDEAVEKYVSELKKNAEISRNAAWIGAQQALAADNPLDKALSTGRPVAADFGRGECIPCKMMKPILEKLAQEFKGKAEILIIDIDEYPDLKRRCGVLFIPAQIFYDASGNETYRHEGFMPEEDIREQLAKLGVG